MNIPTAHVAFGLGISFSALTMSALASASETTTYSYDTLGRLTATASSGSVNNGLGLSYAYDPAGNRTSYTVAGSANGGVPERIVIVVPSNATTPVPTTGFAIIPVNQ